MKKIFFHFSGKNTADSPIQQKSGWNLTKERGNVSLETKGARALSMELRTSLQVKQRYTNILGNTCTHYNNSIHKICYEYRWPIAHPRNKPNKEINTLINEPWKWCHMNLNLCILFKLAKINDKKWENHMPSIALAIIYEDYQIDAFQILSSVISLC